MLVIDASVAVKLAVDEERSDAAHRLAQSAVLFIAPELIWAEVANTLWKKVRRAELDAPAAFSVIEGLEALFSEIVPLQLLKADALRIAVELNHPVYDCFYLALAEQRGVPVMTDDQALAKLAAGTRFEPLIKRLV